MSRKWWPIFVHRYPNGLIAALQADAKYAGKGYGSLVTRAFSKMVATAGDDVYVSTDEDNSRSQSMFGKLGFKCIGEDYDIYTKMAQFSDNVGFSENITKKAKM